MSVARPKILYIEHVLPWPLNGGSQIRSYHTLKTLAEDFDIRLISFVREEKEREYATALAPFCHLGMETIRLPRTRISNLLTAFSSLISGQSFIVARDAAPEMARAIADELSRARYAALWIDHLQMAQFIPDRLGKTKVILDEHNVEYRILQRISETAENPMARWYTASEWPRLRAFEKSAILRADLTTTVSEEDACGLRQLAPEANQRILSVPIGIDTDYFDRAIPEPGRRPSATLLSIGTMYWPPNVDGIHYFHREIFPLIRARKPETRLCVVGAKPVASVVALGQNDPNMEVTGTVPDVRPYARDCAVFIVPLRSGSGMRVKILNALSMGLPVVSTTVGAEGIDVTDGKDILLADTPEAFADAVLTLMADPERARALGIAGRRLIEERYSWPVIGAHLKSVLRQSLPELFAAEAAVR